MWKYIRLKASTFHSSKLIKKLLEKKKFFCISIRLKASTFHSSKLIKKLLEKKIFFSISIRLKASTFHSSKLIKKQNTFPNPEAFLPEVFPPFFER